MDDRGLDYAALAEGVAEMRETMNALVAGLKADGFTDEQAREITAGFFRTIGRGEDDA